MKKLLLLIVTLVLVDVCQAQESSSASADKVTCETGYIVRKGRFRIGKQKCYFNGLYTADGKVCVRMNPHNIPAAHYQCVAPGTEIVAKGALPESVLGWVFLPKSVKTIYTEAFAHDLVIVPYDESKLEDMEETVTTDYISEGASKK